MTTYLETICAYRSLLQSTDISEEKKLLLRPHTSIPIGLVSTVFGVGCLVSTLTSSDVDNGVLRNAIASWILKKDIDGGGPVITVASSVDMICQGVFWTMPLISNLYEAKLILEELKNKNKTPNF